METDMFIAGIAVGRSWMHAQRERHDLSQVEKGGGGWECERGTACVRRRTFSLEAKVLKAASFAKPKGAVITWQEEKENLSNDNAEQDANNHGKAGGGEYLRPSNFGEVEKYRRAMFAETITSPDHPQKTLCTAKSHPACSKQHPAREIHSLLKIQNVEPCLKSWTGILLQDKIDLMDSL